MRETTAVFPPPERVLLGPGPSNVNPRVLKAMSAPVTGHLDPAFIDIMEEIKARLRLLFGTRNELTLPISGTGSAGLEACMVNLIEPGDQVIVGVNGVFGTRLADVAARALASVTSVHAPWGTVISPDQIRQALEKVEKPKIVALVHAETSTGAWQPLEEISRIVHEAGALFVVDCVTSLGGCPVEVDNWGIDAAYSATQKCLSCPPGLATVTFSQGAVDVLRSRRSKPQSWYLDLSLLEQYWGEARVYHHTAPISANYALLEGLRIIDEEGMGNRFQRHRCNHEALVAGLTAMGLNMSARHPHRLWMLNSVAIPPGVVDLKVRQELLNRYGIEIGGGIGPLKGKVWRIGLMGESSTADNVLLVLRALEDALARQGFRQGSGEAQARALLEDKSQG